MIVKSIAIAAFILIIFSLGTALFNLVSNKGQEPSEKAVKALTFRITLSIILFIFVFIAIATGLLQPHGLGVSMQTQRSIPAEAGK
ncbi:MAG: twin transmembrane helix small protein [Methylovulum sp.]|nr:twin transmembrane helix small protein [Methylovulum sp.]